MKRLNINDFNQSYYQFPTALIKNKKYKDMSDVSKIIYMLYINQLEESMLDNQIDENGNIYLYFNDEKLSKITGYTKKQISDAKRELILKNLIKQVFILSRNEIRLYISDFDIEEGDEERLLEELIL